MKDAVSKQRGTGAIWLNVGSAVTVVLVLGVGAPLLWLTANINEAYTPGGSGVTLPVLYALWPSAALLVSYFRWRNPRSPALRGAAVGTVVSILLVAGYAVILFWRK
jgi:hypothetical protein